MTDNLLGYKLLPSVSRNVFTSDFNMIYTTNKIGLREKEIGNSNKFKILFVGDSLTFGEGIPIGQRFSDIIERDFTQFYSINAGVSGYGIHQMYLYIENYGLSLNPNMVICTIIEADLARAIYKKIENSPQLIIKDPNYNLMKQKIILKKIIFKIDKVFKKSYLYVFLSRNIIIAFLKRHLQQRDKEEWTRIIREGEGGYKITTKSQQDWIKDESFLIFKNFKKLLEKSHIEFLVMNISRTQIPWLETYFKKEGINYLDCSNILNKSKNIRFKIDPHYNSYGNQIIANILEEYLDKNQLAKK